MPSVCLDTQRHEARTTGCLHVCRDGSQAVVWMDWGACEGGEEAMRGRGGGGIAPSGSLRPRCDACRSFFPLRLYSNTAGGRRVITHRLLVTWLYVTPLASLGMSSSVSCRQSSYDSRSHGFPSAEHAIRIVTMKNLTIAMVLASDSRPSREAAASRRRDTVI